MSPDPAHPIIDDPSRYPVRLRIDGQIVSRHTLYQTADRARNVWCNEEAARLCAAYASGDRNMDLPPYHEDRTPEELTADFFCRAQARTRVEVWESKRDPRTGKVYAHDWK